MNPNIIVTDVKTSAKQIQMGSTAHFCHACVKNGKKYVSATEFAVVWFFVPRCNCEHVVKQSEICGGGRS